MVVSTNLRLICSFFNKVVIMRVSFYCVKKGELVGKQISHMQRSIRSNRIIVGLSQVPQRLRIPLTFGVLLVLLGAWNLFFFLPLRWKISRFTKQIKINKEQKLAIGRHKILSYRTYDRPITDLNYNVVDAIVTIANNSNVACSRIVPRRERISKFLKRESYELGLIGPFYGIVTFLQQLQSIPASTVIKKLECCRMSNKQICAHIAIDFVRQL